MVGEEQVPDRLEEQAAKFVHVKSEEIPKLVILCAVIAGRKPYFAASPRPATDHSTRSRGRDTLVGKTAVFESDVLELVLHGYANDSVSASCLVPARLWRAPAAGNCSGTVGAACSSSAPRPAPWEPRSAAPPRWAHRTVRVGGPAVVVRRRAVRAQLRSQRGAAPLRRLRTQQPRPPAAT